jgi:hypothetical protein
MEFKAIKFFPEDQEAAGWLVDIGFLMGQLQVGGLIFNHVSKMLQPQDLSIDQSVKLYLTFNMLKIGEKEWLSKLINNIADNMHLADAEQLTGILPAFKGAKQIPEIMSARI